MFSLVWAFVLDNKNLEKAHEIDEKLDIAHFQITLM